MSISSVPGSNLYLFPIISEVQDKTSFHFRNPAIPTNMLSLKTQAKYWLAALSAATLFASLNQNFDLRPAEREFFDTFVCPIVPCFTSARVGCCCSCQNHGGTILSEMTNMIETMSRKTKDLWSTTQSLVGSVGSWASRRAYWQKIRIKICSNSNS